MIWSVSILGKKNVAIIFGGNSSEHEVSKVSASSVIDNLSSDKYNLVLIGITKSGNWFLYNGPKSDIANGSWENHSENKVAFICPDASVGGLVVLDNGKESIIKIDVIIPVLHGKNGEDGTIQGLLQLSGIPFVGCYTTAASACMDKVITNIMLEYAKIPQAKFTWFYSYDFIKSPEECLDKTENELTYPVFVKPANAGSSVGVSKATNRSELKKAIEIAIKEDNKILIEQGINGQEVECAVLGNDSPVASVVGEIAPSNEFYDYEAKYLSGTSNLYIPAHISDEAAERIRELAIKAYRLMGCSGLSRVDFFVEKETGEVMLNELNTFPGFTSISMYPKLMNASGVCYSELLDKLIDLAYERAGRKND